MTVSKKQHGCLHIIQVDKLSTKIIPYFCNSGTYSCNIFTFPIGVPSIIMPSLETGMVYSEEKVSFLSCEQYISHFVFLYFQSYFEKFSGKDNQGHVLLVQLRKHHQDKLALLLLGNCFANQPGFVVCLKKTELVTGPSGSP